MFLSTDRIFGGLLSISLCVAIVVQALVNMSVAVGLLPVTGLPLPLISMGGTSQLFMGISLGIILSVSRQGTKSDADAEDKSPQNEVLEHVEPLS